MGVSGVGKTTVGKELSSKLETPFYDADDFHPESNITKMEAGIPLQDQDRWPWLDLLAAHIKDWKREGAVLACSALKESYRERLQKYNPVVFVYLEASFELISERIKTRKDHFFNQELLQSQFDALEIPEKAITISVKETPEKIANTLMNVLSHKASLGLLGLGVMGKSLARNFASQGITMSLYNRHVAGKEENIALDFIQEHEVLKESLGFDSIPSFIESLALPRKIFLMVNAGPTFDTVLEDLLPYLSKGDIIMDGGNSHYQDTQRRFTTLASKGIHFLGVGVSGGKKGALEGPSIMPGGSTKAYKEVGDFLEKIAALDKAGKPCCTRVGEGGSGHFVKMIHNGIEYAEMQLIAEVYDVLKTMLGYTNDAIALLFKEWNTTDLESYLLEISGNIMCHKEEDTYLIDVILDKAKQKGTGGWSTAAALEIGASLDTISQAVMARIVSGYKKERIKGERLYSLSRKRTCESHDQPENEALKRELNLSIETIKQAYTAARIINHCIGIEALRKASLEYEWELNLGEITRIWTNGCIIRSAFMEDLAPILNESDTSLFLNKKISQAVKSGLDELITFTTAANKAYIAVPVFSAAVQYILAFTRGESSASMIQAQRDYFGAHTYERKDKTGSFHTHWEN